MGDSVLLNPSTTIAMRLDQDLDVAIRMHDWINPDSLKYAVGGERSSDLLVRLRTDAVLRGDLQGAEVIVFDVPVGIINDLCPDPVTITEDEQRRCFAEVVPAYQGDVAAIFDELVALRSPSDAIVRVTDVWQLAWPTLHQVGNYDVVRAAWQAMNQAVRDAAASHDIPVVLAYDAFTGPNGDRNPVAAGDLSTDEYHLSAQGVYRFVDMLAALGYAPLR